MRVAWVTHRSFDDTGGAERADRMMLDRRPDDVKVTIIRPGGVADDLEEFDRVVVAGMYGYSASELRILARCKPVVWAHDMQFTGHWLYEEASIFIALNKVHLQWEQEKSRLKGPRVELNPGWMDTNLCYALTKSPNSALWAHRNIGHKGLGAAIEWADETGADLEIMMSQPHQKVIEAMRVAEYFVLISEIRDPGPFAVMEAHLCECKLITENVGYTYDRDELRETLNNADKHFWGLVCESP